jgi:peptidoglycan/xylan/chitin deacetylase (PgdA/CDA1 family)
MVVLAGACYLLQTDDTPMPAPPDSDVASPVDYYPTLQPAVGDRDFYVTHRAVVAYGRTELELPILMYHYIRTPPSPRRDLVGYNLSTSPTVFAQQMDWLGTHSYHPITFNDVRLYWQRVQPLPSKPVIITLDDGYRDLYTTAFPILVSHGFTAVAYIVSGFVGLNGYVSRDQIMQMDQYGFEIAAHTVNHANLAKASDPWLTYQLVESKRWLEKLVGHPVLDMAYPSGKYNQQTVLAVARAGYYSATTEQYGIWHTQNDRYVWTRVRVGGGEPMNMFISSLGPSMPTVTITSFPTVPGRAGMLLES